MAETTYEADEHVILVDWDVGAAVRDFVATLGGWLTLDAEGISRTYRERRCPTP